MLVLLIDQKPTAKLQLPRRRQAIKLIRSLLLHCVQSDEWKLLFFLAGGVRIRSVPRVDHHGLEHLRGGMLL